MIIAPPVSRERDSRQALEQRPPSVTPTAAPRPWVSTVLLSVYLAGVLLFLTHLVYGWFLASAMIRRAARSGIVATTPRFRSTNHPT